MRRLETRLVPITLSFLLALPVSATQLDTVEPAEAAALLARKKRPTAEEIAAEEAAAAQAAEEETQRLADEARAAAAADLEKQQAEADTQRKAEAEAAAKRAAEANASVVEATGLDARVRRLSDALARAIKRIPGDHRDQTFAVMPFVEADEESQSRRLGLVVSDLVITNLSRDHRVPLVERAALGKIMQEQSLQASGAVDPAKVAEVGALAGASAMIIGDVVDTGESFLVTAKLISMENATVLAAEQATLPKEELIAFSADSVVLRSRAGGFFRSAVAPGWGQVYNREPIKAGIVAAAVGVLGLSALTALVVGGVQHGAYTNFTPAQLESKDVALTQENISAEVTGLRNSANAWYTTGIVFLGLTAVAWTGGALDAWISGTDVESLDDALATN